MNVTEALTAQAIGSLDRQIGNGVRMARSRGKVLALGPMSITRSTSADQRTTISLSHQYIELEPAQPAPAGWVIVTGEEP